jgi:GNAT superfamily N-acetyltransferase
MMALRLARVADLAGLAALHPSAPRDIAAQRCWVAERDGAVSGFVVFDYAFFENGFVHWLYVAPEKRRTGLGSALMRQCESICRTPKLFTSTNLSNLPMQALLNRLGYALTGTVHHLDEGDPELFYFKRVQP